MGISTVVIITAVVVLTMIVTTTGAIAGVNAATNSTTTPGMHCSDNDNCVAGKAVELSSAKWKCINGVLDGAFEKATSNPKLNSVITSVGIAVCLKGA